MISDKQKYDKERYRIKRLERYEGRKCRTCDIKLGSKFAGEHSKIYCGLCIRRGVARKDQNRRYYKKNRKRILKRIKYGRSNTALKEGVRITNRSTES